MFRFVSRLFLCSVFSRTFPLVLQGPVVKNTVKTVMLYTVFKVQDKCCVESVCTVLRDVHGDPPGRWWAVARKRDLGVNECSPK